MYLGTIVQGLIGSTLLLALGNKDQYTNTQKIVYMFDRSIYRECSETNDESVKVSCKDIRTAVLPSAMVNRSNSDRKVRRVQVLEFSLSVPLF
jgi:hypothetical protein